MQDTDPLLKYKVGFGILGVIVAILLISTLAGATAIKQDAKTQKSAEDIAKKLNTYIDEKNVIPENLNKAGIKGVDENIKYERLSSKEYKFCVNYSSGSSGYNNGLTTAVLDNLYAVNKNDNAWDKNKDVTLYIDTVHKKGENCKTIEPYLASSSYNYGNSRSNSSSSLSEQDDLYYKCAKQYNDNYESPSALDDYYDCLDASY